jgi:hypothetical protein
MDYFHPAISTVYIALYHTFSLLELNRLQVAIEETNNRIPL